MKQDLVAQTDVATLLGRLADELRGGSLAISGAVRQFSPKLIISCSVSSPACKRLSFRQC